MKLATYFDNGPRIGLVDSPDLWDLRELYALYLFETERTPRNREIAKWLVPNDMAMFIRLNHGRLEILQEAFEFIKSQRKMADVASLVRPIERTRLLPPVLSPSKIICCGSSYVRYLEAGGKPKSEWPQDVKVSFLKQPTALIGHKEKILYPPDASQWDYENELTIVIGRTCSDVSETDVDKYIFGYSIVNDACVRDIPAWTGRLDSPRGKAVDTLAPFGPYIVPVQYLNGDPNDLHLVTTVDGEVRQDDRTSGLLWTVQRIVAFTSRYMRLMPGDIILTGTTLGNALSSGKYLKEGQIVRCEIEGIGALENEVGVRSWSSKLLSHVPPGSEKVA